MYPPLLFEEEYLTWKEGSGWFDCNKTFNYYGDGNMRWAAAASNLIQLVAGTEPKYIEAYDKEYGPEYKDLSRPEKYNRMTESNQQHSEVFNFFKSSFDNLGSWGYRRCQLVHKRKQKEPDTLFPKELPWILQQGVFRR